MALGIGKDFMETIPPIGRKYFTWNSQYSIVRLVYSTQQLLSNVVVLLELIFIRDGSFDLAVDDVPRYSQDKNNSFISSIWTAIN